MDAFRYVELPDPYIYVIDPTDGHTKAVIDKFFSFLWVERRAEAGELEITAPEDTFWGSVIAEGDYIQFKASSTSDYFREARRPSNVGRYTMVVEAKYTTYDADNGYTTYVKGHSLDILLNRRINLGIVENHPMPAVEIGDGTRNPDQSLTGKNDYRRRIRDGYLFGLPVDTDEYNPAQQEMKRYEDNGWAYYGITMMTRLGDPNHEFNDPTMPYIVENLVSDSTKAPYKSYGIRAADLITKIVYYNCGEGSLLDTRQFPNFTVRMDNFDDLKTDDVREQTIDGRFENVYDLVTDLLPRIAVYEYPREEQRTVPDPENPSKTKIETTTHSSQTYLSERLVGWTEGVPPYNENHTVFKMGFELYKGRDLTIDGPNKNVAPVIYSRDMDNLISMNYLTGEANYKNVIYYDTKYDYTPDDIWKKNKEIEALNKEKDLLDIEDQDAREKKTKEIEDKIEKLQTEVEKLQDDYDKRGLRIPYISVIDRTQMTKYTDGSVTISDYPSGLDRREMYVDDDLPFMGRIDTENDTEVEWQGRPYLKYRYTIRHDADQNVENSKPTYEDKYLAIEWNQNLQSSMTPIAKTTFKLSENSKENDVEAELNYNAIYQPKRNYDIGDLVTVMGLHHNEITRTAQIDEMAYSIDPSGYTIVPTFTILPIEDDAV